MIWHIPWLLTQAQSPINYCFCSWFFSWSLFWVSYFLLHSYKTWWREFLAPEAKWPPFCFSDVPSDCDEGLWTLKTIICLSFLAFLYVDFRIWVTPVFRVVPCFVESWWIQVIRFNQWFQSASWRSESITSLPPLSDREGFVCNLSDFHWDRTRKAQLLRRKYSLHKVCANMAARCTQIPYLKLIAFLCTYKNIKNSFLHMLNKIIRNSHIEVETSSSQLFCNQNYTLVGQSLAQIS